MVRRVPIASAQSRADYAVGEAGLVPMPGTRWKRMGDVWVRLYRNDDGVNFSMAFTDDDLLSPPSEFGLMLKSRVAQARRNFVK